ncbi:unnamed protein product [Meganyctiphanes norvegica]|uniref:Sarcosine dehydrogenase n=1 Tax=Meganyctiphanes norvegica TaxID=48144 RepID=A0AAV2RMJ0_MEGNR
MLTNAMQPDSLCSCVNISVNADKCNAARQLVLSKLYQIIRLNCVNISVNADKCNAARQLVLTQAGADSGGSGICGDRSLKLGQIIRLNVRESTEFAGTAHLSWGTIWYANGLVWRLRPGDTDVAILNATRDQMLTLEEEEPAGWITNGGLFIASNKLRLQEYSRLYTLGRVMGVECELLSPQEVSELYPMMSVDDIAGALYSPGDGTIDPATLCATLTRKAKVRGAKVFEGVGVTEVETVDTLFGRKSIQTVHTNLGSIKTKALVNCAGVWSSGNWCRDVGQQLPLVAVKHSIIVMNDIPGVRTLPNVRDHDANMCLRVQGDCLIIGGYEKGPELWEKVEPDFSFGLFDFDFDGFSEILEGAVHRVPALGEVGLKTTLCGPEAFTPDRKPLLGEDGDVSGLFHGSGFNSSGCMLSGGCAEQLAHWIANGRPFLDMYAYDCRRFSNHVRGKQDWAWARSHEAYTNNYSIVFPRNQPLAGRGAIVDVLYQPLTAAGCFWEESSGWERPGFFLTDGRSTPLLQYDWQGMYGHESHHTYSYKDILGQGLSFQIPLYDHLVETEYNALKQSAVLVNLSSSGKVLLGGLDVEAAVDYLFMNGISKDGGSVTPSLLLNQRGGVDAALTLFTLHDELRPREHPWETGSTHGTLVVGRVDFISHMFKLYIVCTRYVTNSAIFVVVKLARCAVRNFRPAAVLMSESDAASTGGHEIHGLFQIKYSWYECRKCCAICMKTKMKISVYNISVKHHKDNLLKPSNDALARWASQQNSYSWPYGPANDHDPR